MFAPNEKFFSTNDIRQKIDVSVIRFNGKAYYARHNGESDQITLYRVETQKTEEKTPGKKISYDHPDLDFSSPPLGFMNYTPTNCMFLSRIPSRRFVSGLQGSALECTSLNGQPCNLPFSFPWSDNLRKTIEDEYESAISILNRLKKHESAWSQAFNRSLAFGYTKTNGLRLFHKHVPIAIYNENNKGFEPLKTSNFLVDSILQKNGIKYYHAA